MKLPFQQFYVSTGLHWSKMDNSNCENGNWSTISIVLTLGIGHSWFLMALKHGNKLFVLYH